MVTKRTSRSSGNYHATNVHSGQKDSPIITEFERGSIWASWLLVGMFAFLSAGVWWFGW